MLARIRGLLTYYSYTPQKRSVAFEIKENNGELQGLIGATGRQLHRHPLPIMEKPHAGFGSIPRSGAAWGKGRLKSFSDTG